MSRLKFRGFCQWYSDNLPHFYAHFVIRMPPHFRAHFNRCCRLRTSYTPDVVFYRTFAHISPPEPENLRISVCLCLHWEDYTVFSDALQWQQQLFLPHFCAHFKKYLPDFGTNRSDDTNLFTALLRTIRHGNPEIPAFFRTFCWRKDGYPRIFRITGGLFLKTDRTSAHNSPHCSA